MSTDIYAIPDLTKKVRQRDGTEDSGQLEEERGDMEERVVDIYEGVDDLVSGPQEDRREDTAGRHTQVAASLVSVLNVGGQWSKTLRRPFRVVALCLGMLCLALLGVVIGQAMRPDNPASYHVGNNLTLERDHLKINYSTLILERDKLWSEVNQLKEAAEKVKTCPSGWMKFADSCYYTPSSTERKTWEESKEQCLKTAGADLVIINNKEEQDFIIRGLNGWNRASHTWIGLKRTAGNWAWLDGAPLTTQYWGRGSTGVYTYPRDQIDLNCAYYWYDDGKWYNDACSSTYNWICEK